MTNAPAGPLRKRALSRGRLLVAAAAALLIAAVAWVWHSFVRTEFPLEEIPIPPSGGFFSGPSAGCLETPSPDVKEYPRFASSAPLFGRIDLDPNASGGKALVPYHFALDESKGTGTGYDTLYLDTNSNLDLTDDRPLVTKPGAPELMTTFEHIAVGWNFGPGIPSRPIEFIPTFRFDPRRGYASMMLAYASVRRGRIRIGGRAYDVTLKRSESANGRYDNPGLETGLTVVRPRRICLFKHSRLVSVHPPDENYVALIQMPRVGGKWYRLSTTPVGDVLSVKPYTGDTGILQIGAGGLAAMGYILTADALVRLEETDVCGLTPWTDRFDIPVGDYCVGGVLVKAGPLHVNLKHNTASEGIPKDADNHPPRYFIQIRKDRPFVLELPQKLEVLFTSPAKDERFKPGETLNVKSMLLDRVRDIRITDIGDERPKLVAPPLDAAITIRHSSGIVVSQGTISIRELILYGYSWQIPADFRPKGGQQRLTITVSYDTLDLFGKIESSREIIVENPEGQ